ncbi:MULTISPECIES: T9SS type A sorting domain-containing protein [Flavobacterium]|uniref:T9SS type A sorting domain-containing protein n=1 Tax=Flavobacterium hankyongi TaxID=1176532 RepID=A0ABP8ZWN2_9FLAO|nr:T9SS type A sorting domain-containing protein [Flavobacterium sp. N1846]
MKKITFLLVTFFISLQINAQLYQVPTCSGGISTNIYGNMNSVATANATSRSAIIYPATQLAGISGQVLNAVYFKRMAASGTMGGSPTLKVYLKETSATDFGAAAIDWATEIATATLVYDSNPSVATGSSAGWKSFSFSNNFTYSGTQNLAVYMEYVNTASSTAIGWDYEYGTPCISTTNSNTTKYINNTTGTPGASLTSTNYRRPQIGFDYVVTCPAPTSFNYANLTATTVDLNWIAGGSETSWEYVIQPTANPAPTSGTTIGTNAVIAASVSPNTAYTAYLRANCGAGGFSTWKMVSFTTPCSTYNVPSSENFSTYVPGCWQEADNGDTTVGPATFGSSSWIEDGFGNVGSTGAARYNIFTTGANDWLMSPIYNIPASGYELKFDAAATQYGATTAPTTAWEADDYVEVLVSTGTTNWTLLYTYNSSNVPSNTGSTNIIDLDAYAGQSVRFAFRVVEGASNGSADIDFSIDNFEIRLSPACSNPISLAVNGLTQSSATVTWGVTTGNYEYVINNVATDPVGSGTPLSGETYNATVLSPLTTYYFHVRTVCSGPLYSVWSTISFTTPAAPPVNDDCVNAIALTVGGIFGDNDIAGSVLGGNTTAGVTPSCQSNFSADVWYSVIVPASGNLTIETQVAATNSMTDSVVAAFSGTCGSLTEIGCDDDGGPTGANNLMSILSLTGRTPGEVIYVGVWKYNTTAPTSTNSEFIVSAYDASLSTTSFDKNSLKVYPNPVNDVLNLSYSSEISSVEVFNIIGQKVLVKNLNATQGEVNISNLNSGSYIVRVTSGDQVQTIKIVKN